MIKMFTFSFIEPLLQILDSQKWEVLVLFKMVLPLSRSAEETAVQEQLADPQASQRLA